MIFVCPSLDHRLIFFQLKQCELCLAQAGAVLPPSLMLFPARDGQGRRRGQERRSRCHGGDREDGQRLLQVESELEGYMEISQNCPQTSPYFRQPSTMLEGRHEPCLRQGKEQMRLSPQN